MKSIRYFLLFSCAVLCCIDLSAQMKRDGEAPEPLYKKYPANFQYTSVADFVEGDQGWFDFYLNAFTIDHTGRMWIAGNDGLSYSDDNGLSWKYSYKRHATFAIFETRKHTLLSSGTNEYLLRSTNHGKSWRAAKERNVGSGRSSHGERYDDIFYLQVDDERIIRTCQYANKLLISDNDGLTWHKTTVPDRPVSIMNSGDTLLIMFTYDELYLSRDRGETWQRQRDGLPKNRLHSEDEKYQHNGVIDCGVVMDDGTIMALISSQEEDVYENYPYCFDVHSSRWIPDTSQRAYVWGESFLPNGGNNRLFKYNDLTHELSVSFDKGQNWGVIWKTNSMWDYPHSFFANGNDVYFIHYTSVSVIHFPKVEKTPEPVFEYQKFVADEESGDKLILFPSSQKLADENPEFTVYQLSANNGEGYARFFMHIPNDTILNEINILERDRGILYINQSFSIARFLTAGDYEIRYYNVDYRGCYFLNILLEGRKIEDEDGTVCYFY